MHSKVIQISVQVAPAAVCWATHFSAAADLRPLLLVAQPAVVDIRVDEFDHHTGFIEYHGLRRCLNDRIDWRGRT